MPAKIALAHLPTPLWRNEALDALVGTEVWVKRDDMTAGAEAGNKARKLEYLLADALDRGAKAVITCGAAQSNHARATALLARSVGLHTVLYLRTQNPAAPPANTANLLLDRLSGADVRFISPTDYRERGRLMEAAREALAATGTPAYLIAEGGSSGLGSLGYVDAMEEVRRQLDLGLAGSSAPFDAVVHACGSGGTAAGIALGSARHGVANRVLSMAVCDDRTYFQRRIGQLVTEARSLLDLPPPVDLEVIDTYKGPGHGIATREQLQFIATVARTCGLIVDPVYVGKALYGLSKLDPKPARVLFVHTGGLLEMLAAPDDFCDVVSSPGTPPPTPLAR